MAFILAFITDSLWCIGQSNLFCCFFFCIFSCTNAKPLSCAGGFECKMNEWNWTKSCANEKSSAFISLRVVIANRSHSVDYFHPCKIVINYLLYVLGTPQLHSKYVDASDRGRWRPVLSISSAFLLPLVNCDENRKISIWKTAKPRAIAAAQSHCVSILQ